MVNLRSQGHEGSPKRHGQRHLNAWESGFQEGQAGSHCQGAGLVDGNRRMFWSYFFHGVKPKTKGDGENPFRPYLFGDGAARSRRLQPDCRLPCSCRRNEELPGQPRWDCSGVAVRSGHVKKRVAFSTFSPSAGHIIRSFRLNDSAQFHQISTFVFKHSSRVLSTYQPSAPTDFVFPLLWAIQLWSDVLNSRHRLR